MPHVPRPSESRLREMLKKHRTLTAVAQELRVSDTTVGRWCRALGVETPPRGRPRADK